jgi:hypothetical protein
VLRRFLILLLVALIAVGYAVFQGQ